MKAEKLIFNSSYDAEKILRIKYPDLKCVMVVAFSISHAYYMNDTLTEKIAETRYTNIKNTTFLGVKVELIYFK